jgi:hypothetical protein
MKLFATLSIIVAFLYLLPVRLVSIITERAISARREAAWISTPRDQAILAAAHAAALRQAQLFTAYPGPARLAIGTLRLVGAR